MTLIYVDLVKDEPIARDVWEAQYPDLETDDADQAYAYYVSRFQPWRVAIKSGDNEEELFRSTESYFNRADAEHAARIGYGRGSNVYLREHEKGNVELRLASDAVITAGAFGLECESDGQWYRMAPISEIEQEVNETDDDR